MKYSPQEIQRMFSENNGNLPQYFVDKLHSALSRGDGISMPVFEEEGRIKILHLNDCQYHLLSPESSELYRMDAARRETERRKREWRNSPEYIAQKEKRDNEFWEKYAIRARVIAMRDWQKMTGDPRLQKLWDIENSAREEYVQGMRRKGEPFSSFDAEIAGAEAVFAHVEANHPDLYAHIQKSMKWFDEDLSQQ
jgi:hypothetical protein